jgi:hypothetical protein
VANEIEADVPPPTAAAELAAMTVPAPAATATSETDALSEELLDHRPLIRRLIAGAAAVTLIACFGWAIGHRKHPPVVSQIPVPSWPAPAANAAAPRVAPPAAPPVAVATDPVNTASFVEVPTATRTHVAKKRPARRLSNDVTIDPFKQRAAAPVAR